MLHVTELENRSAQQLCQRVLSDGPGDGHLTGCGPVAAEHRRAGKNKVQEEGTEEFRVTGVQGASAKRRHGGEEVAQAAVWAVLDAEELPCPRQNGEPRTQIINDI